ncbi:MAG: MarC family protein [Patescibacteria group bacterium]|nr:MarC family protein [Patescibacteria group bacterium]
MIPTSLLQPFFAIFGAVDPVGNVPFFLTLTAGKTEKEKRHIAFHATVRAAIILAIFTLAGSFILDVFSVSLSSFRIAGGVVFVILGLSILFGFSLGSSEAIEATEDVITVPLATPTVAGPGTISMAIVLVKEYGYLVTLATILINVFLQYLAFRWSFLVLKLLGRHGTSAFAKIMGLIIVAIGIEFIRRGLAA